VSHIRCEAGGVRAVVLEDGTEIRCTHVVSNADPHATAALPDPVPLRWKLRLRALRYSISALSIFLAARVDPARFGVGSGNLWIFRTGDAGESMYRFAADADPLSAPVPAAFLTCTSAKDPSKRRRDGIATFEVFTLVSYEAFARYAATDPDSRPSAYRELKERLADRVLQLVDKAVPGLFEQVAFRAVGTPITNHWYVNATRGALYGTEKRLAQLGPLGFGPSTPVRNLWMCGASALGHGVAGATMSGLATAAALLGTSPRRLLTGQGAVEILARPTA
jgi:phytoene dehydrogenase-like protein